MNPLCSSINVKEINKQIPLFLHMLLYLVAKSSIDKICTLSTCYSFHRPQDHPFEMAEEQTRTQSLFTCLVGGENWKRGVRNVMGGVEEKIATGTSLVWESGGRELTF